MLHIGVIGQVSSGKSSLVNGLVGGFYSEVSLGRKTILPRRYSQTHQPAETQNLDSKLLAAIRNGNLTAEEKLLLSQPVDVHAKIPYTLIDFAGVNDGENKFGDIFLGSFAQNLPHLDIILFVTSSETAFTLSSECAIYEKIVMAIDENRNNGRWQQLIVVFNKYDRVDDEYDEIRENALAKMPITDYYVVSAHRLIRHRINNCTFEINGAVADWHRRELAKIDRAECEPCSRHSELDLVAYVSSVDAVKLRKLHLMRIFGDAPADSRRLFEIAFKAIDLRADKQFSEYITRRLCAGLAGYWVTNNEYLFTRLGIELLGADSLDFILSLLPDDPRKNGIKMVYHCRKSGIKTIARYILQWEGLVSTIILSAKAAELGHPLVDWYEIDESTRDGNGARTATILWDKIHVGLSRQDNRWQMYEFMRPEVREVFDLRLLTFQRAFAEIIKDSSKYIFSVFDDKNTIRNWIIDSYVVGKKRGAIGDNLVKFIAS